MMPDQNAYTDLDFSAFKRKVKQTWGLDLEAYKRPQMERRLRANMDKCGARSFTQYYSMMLKDSALAEEFLDRVTINVSELFRNPEQFETLRTRVLPEILKWTNSPSVWSAGCSYGAEPYTLAVLLEELCPGNYSILATDIDDKMLMRGRIGKFSAQDMRNVSPERTKKFFDPVGLDYQAKDVLKRKIAFRKHDLLREEFKKGFDLILCRNVVIYFTDEAKAVLYSKFFESLRPGGYLFVGGTERIANSADIGFESSFSFFYKKPGEH